LDIKAPAAERSGIRLLFSSSILLFVIAHFTHHLINALTVPLLPFIRDDFHLDYTQSGLVISAFTLSYGLAQLPAGWLTDHIGARIMITISIIGVAAAGLLVGLSTTYLMLLGGLIFMGIIGGGYHPSAPPLVMAATTPQNRSKALGFHMIGGSASHFLAPLLGGAIAAAWGWRMAYTGLAAPMIIFGIIFYIVLGRRNAANGVSDVASKKKDTVIQDSAPRASMGRIALFIVLGTIVQALTTTTISFIPLYLVDRYGLDKTLAAALISLIYFSGIWASPLGGYLADRFGQMPVILIATLFGGPLIYLMNLVPYGILIFALLIAFGMVGPMRNPVSEGYIAGNTPLSRRSTVLGFYYFGNQESGGLFTPVVGYVVDRFGFVTGFTAVAIIMTVASVIFVLFFWGKGDKKALNLAK
jgi:MFS family permease